MENLNLILGMFNGPTIIGFMLKAFALIFSIMYLLYAVIISKQTETMNKTLESNNGYVLKIIASLQITFAFILIVLAVFLL